MGVGDPSFSSNRVDIVLSFFCAAVKNQVGSVVDKGVVGNFQHDEFPSPHLDIRVSLFLVDPSLKHTDHLRKQVLKKI